MSSTSKAARKPSSEAAHRTLRHERAPGDVHWPREPGRSAAFGATDIADSVDTSTAFRQGMLTNVLNPKVALFFLALMPQFIEPDSPTKVGAFLVLGLTFLTTGTVWCLVLALGASRVRSFLASHPRALQGLSQGSGVLFIFLGLRLAASTQ